MTENMQKFLTAVTQNDEMYSKLNEATKEDLIAMAKELGIELTEADFEQKPAELNDDELDAVAGGAACYCPMTGVGVANTAKADSCGCVMGGGGQWSDKSCRCACVGYGQGEDDRG